MRLLFWQNAPSPHQSSLIRALADRPDLDVTLIAQDPLQDWRREMGWVEPDFGQAQVIVQPTAAAASRLLEEAGAEDVHVFSGTRAHPMVWKVFQQALHKKARAGLLSEPGKFSGAFGIIRRLTALSDAAHYRWRLDFILAIGHLGERWFLMTGYDRRKIYPFAYFTEAPMAVSSRDMLQSNAGAGEVKMIFIGRCTRRKGLDLLISALAQLRHLDWELVIVGDGDERVDLERRSHAMRLEDRIRFIRNKANVEAMRLLDASDLLVLPSRWDGWGAVVNEALMRGVPVLCSDRCGAASLVRHNEQGEVFPTGSVTGLRDALARRISAGKKTQESTRVLRAWAHAITGESAADYLLSILASVYADQRRPAPPWSR